MDSKKTQQNLESIHDALTVALLERIRSGGATAADLNVARAFLKDNGVDVGNPATMQPLTEALTDVLPFEAPDQKPAAKRKGA